MAFTFVEDEKVEEVQPTTTENITKGIASSLGAGVAQVLGLPGDVLSLVNDYVAGPLTSVFTGRPSIPYEKTPIGKLFGTSAQMEAGIQDLIPFTKPTNDYQRTANDITKTFTSLLTPGAQAKIGKLPFSKPVRALVKSVGAKLFGQATEDITGSQEKGGIGEAGSLFLMSILDRPSAANLASQLYKRSQKQLAQAGNPILDTPSTRQSLEALKGQVSKGTLAPSEQAVVNEIDKILTHFQGNAVPVENLTASLRSLNENLQTVMQTAGGREGRTRAKQLFKSINGILNQGIKEYGKSNPSFYKSFSDAQNIYGTLAQSNFIQNRAAELLNYSPKNPVVPYMFLGALEGGANALGGGSSVLPAAAAYQATKFLYRMTKSKPLAHHYTKALGAAALDDAATFNREIKKVDQIYSKLDDNQKYTFVE